MKSLLNANWKILLIIMVLVPSLAWAIGTTTVTISPNQANNYAQYTIHSSTGSGNNDLEANQDSVIVIFNANTTVPGSINPSLITVNNTTSNAVNVNGQRVSILTPVFIRRNSTPITVVINQSANIQNPSTPASNYTIQFATTKESAVTSQQYTISASSSTVTPAAVTPNPSVAGESAAYTIAFDVGSGGTLIANESTITVDFPLGTTLPPDAISGVTINSTSASATASNDTIVVITSPVNVSNNGSVNIEFAIGSGLQNPETPGSFTLNIFTSTETEPISSESYTISSSTALSISAITAKPDTVNQADIFELDFRVGNTGALIANVDTITLAFQQNTFLPVDMSPANITVSSGGFSDNAAGIKVLKNINTDDDTLHIIIPINIASSADVTVTLNASSGYLNPSLAGNYSLFLRTSQDITGATSNPYAIFNTTTRVSMATVVPADNSQNTWTDYTINFNLGRLGRLKAGESTITITFQSGYDVSEYDDDYDASQLIIGETDIYDLTASEIEANNTAKTIQITIPDDAVTDNSDNIELILSGNTPIFNPNTQQNYTLWVQTSVEPSSVASQTYNIGGTSITNLSVTSNNSVNKEAKYDLSFDIYREINIGPGSNPDDYIVVVFPEGTVMPADIDGANVSIEGTAKNHDDITVNQSTRTVTIPVEFRIRPSNNPVTLQFASDANIVSPIVPSNTFYKIIAYTSQDETPVTSPAYSITGNNSQVTSVSGTPNPAAITATGVQFTVNFTTSDSGKIAGGRSAGSSTVTIDFDAATYVPASITPSKVQINSTPCTAVSVLSGDTYGGVVRLTVPNGLIIGNNTAATVVFDTSAGLVNGGTAGTYDLQVRTSSDTLYSETAGTEGDYTLFTSQSLSVTSVTPNPSTQNAAASYSVKFKTGSPDGALSVADTISLTFPDNTYLPASASPNDITVNGTSLSENPVILDSILKVTVPTGVTIGNLTDVTVLINQVTGILNPTVVGGYILQVSTESEAGPFNSPSYNITQTSSTVSAANVTVADPRPSFESAYTIDFAVGARGRLYAGTSTITVTFNASTSVNGDSLQYNSTSIIVGEGSPTTIPTANISINGKAVIMKVPSSVSVNNNDNITLVIDGTTSPIINPGSSGSYTLQVRTSVETSNITTNSYYISSVGAVSTITNTLSNSNVNATAANTIAFMVGATLSASTGTITIKFPNNTLVPSSIATSNVQVTSSQPAGSGDASAVVTNSANRSITLNMPIGVSADIGAGVTVQISSDAGIQNPSIYGDKTLLVHTSSQPVDGTSAAYTLIANTAITSTITNFTVYIDPNSPSTIAEHTFSFITGPYGRLLSGTSSITLLIPDNATFTLGAPASAKVTINSTQTQSVTLNTGSPDELIVTVPSSVTIGNNANVTVVIDATAGLQTASTTAPLTYTAYTSVENTSVNHEYSLPVQLTTFEAEARNEVIVINWQTESEFNNASWRLERKEITASEFRQFEEGTLDVLSAGTDFVLIAEIEGQGTTVDMTNYEFIDNNITAGGIYVYRIADISYNGQITYHSPVVQKAAIPVVFSLAQNYPNPFNPTTTIKFTLPVAAKVRIIIYNILGQEVVRLVDNKILDTGWHSMQWHGLNRNHDRVASGLYIFRMEAKSNQGNKRFVKAHKMILLK
jgi:hypothetical protein